MTQVKEFTIMLVRHGETDANLNGIISSSFDWKLNENGLKQVKALGASLKNEKFSRAFSSDLSRAHDTTITAMSKSIHPQPEIVVDKRLRERYGGLWEGKYYKEILEEEAKLNISRHILYGLKGGETEEEALNRVVHFMKEIFELCDAEKTSQNILVGTHCLCIYYYLKYLKSKDGQLFELMDYNEDSGHPPNTAITKMRIFPCDGNSRRKIQFLSINDTSHLKMSNLEAPLKF